MSKELWLDLYEEFVEEHGREPTEEEMQNAQGSYIDHLRGAYEDYEQRGMA